MFSFPCTPQHGHFLGSKQKKYWKAIYRSIIGVVHYRPEHEISANLENYTTLLRMHVSLVLHYFLRSFFVRAPGSCNEYGVL
jgi:hypothetical protein